MLKKAISLVMVSLLLITQGGCDMANIKTLYGSDKLREAYPKINENFNALNSDIDGIKSRVNKIITTPIDGEAAAQEIVDARGEYSTLGERLDEIEQSGGGGSAAEITYDNAESELEADNVQNAIDETVEIINAHKAENAKVLGQTKFIDLLKSNTNYKSITVKRIASSVVLFNIYLNYGLDKYVVYKFYGNTYDDYIVLGEIAIGEYIDSSPTDIQAIFSTGSIKEFAWSMRPAGTSYIHRFFPMHNSIGTAFKINDPKFIIDGIETDFTSITTQENISDFKLVQKVNYKHPDYSNNLAEMTTIHSIALDGGVDINCKATFLEDTEINAGYVNMIPSKFCKELVTGYGNRYVTIKTDGSKTYLTQERDNVTDYILVSSDMPNYIGCVEMKNLRNTLRHGASDRNEPVMYIEHRSNGIQKLYPYIYKDSLVPAGTTHRFGATYMAAEIPSVFDLI